MLLSRDKRGVIVEIGNAAWLVTDVDWNTLLLSDTLEEDLAERVPGNGMPCSLPASADLLAPIGAQEVWAAGVTYFKSRTARMEESAAASGSAFYDHVYSAPRPELFFKATHQRVMGPGMPLRVRSDSTWTVPEPELALMVTPNGKLIGYTIGNDMSARDIEGENPLYLPQAKVYTGSCSLGPKVLIRSEPLPADTAITMTIERGGRTLYEDSITLAKMKRNPQELIEYLYRDNSFRSGAVLLTGTGIVPDSDISLRSGDHVSISIDGIGELQNPIA